MHDFDGRGEPSAGGAATKRPVDPNDGLEFILDSSDGVGGAERVESSGSTTSLTLGAQIAFTSHDSGYVEEATSFGSHTSYEVDFASETADVGSPPAAAVRQLGRRCGGKARL